MGVTAAIIICAIAIGIFAQASTGGARAGVIWGAIHFAASSIFSVAAVLAKPYIFPDALRPQQGLFEKKLSTAGMLASWCLDKLISYGPVILITILLFVFVCTAAKGVGRRRGGAVKNIDWRARMR